MKTGYHLVLWAFADFFVFLCFFSLQCTSHIPHPRPRSTEGPADGEPGGVRTQG